MSRLNLYALFHCNLAFSLIPRDEFPSVIKNCYWPLLRMAEDGIPIGIEMTAWTLREVQAIDPSFTTLLKELLKKRRLSFIGSGYSQAIMPLIPAEVNRWNLSLGNKYYMEILGVKPTIALVNEQTYSAGLVGLYKEAGYEAIIMDWNNCSRHNEYVKGALYTPQRVAGIGAGEEIGLLWSHSIAFQKFHRCVHGEITAEEYRDYLLSHYNEKEERAFVAYSNDAEVFDYSPGLGARPQRDFKRVGEVLRGLKSETKFTLLRPEEIINKFNGAALTKPISLHSAETPIVCKKQERYNPLRWSVTGRDSAHINARCYGIYKRLRELGSVVSSMRMEALWERLCELWGSDFRTNTCDDKLASFNESLGWLSLESSRLMQEAGLLESDGAAPLEMGRGVLAASEENGLCYAGAGGPMVMTLPTIAPWSCGFYVQEDKRRLQVATSSVEMEFIKDRGLALKTLSFPEVCTRPLLGTISHGYFDSIEFGADFFSSHLIHTDREGVKTTDLLPVSPVIVEDEAGVTVRAVIDTAIGRVIKEYYIPRLGQEFSLTYRLTTGALAASSLRLGIFTLLPDAFDKDTLWFETINGGTEAERFFLKGRTLSHERPVSRAISASSCLGATEGWVRFGDDEKTLCVLSERRVVYTVPMINYRESGGSFFLRLSHSAGELDDTAYWLWRGCNEVTFTVRAEKAFTR